MAKLRHLGEDMVAFLATIGAVALILAGFAWKLGILAWFGG